LGGGRRDEEKARAKERFFSHRDEFGQWDPKNQRPELWNIFNGRKHFGEHFRVFPLSNWTEMDVWQYIRQEKIPLPSLYFSHQRKIINRHGQLLDAETGFVNLLEEEKAKIEEMTIRFRTVGDVTCTGAVLSTAATLDDIVAEGDGGPEKRGVFLKPDSAKTNKITDFSKTYLHGRSTQSRRIQFAALYDGGLC
jgi:sulfate adenylyltransferase subunit 2